MSESWYDSNTNTSTNKNSNTNTNIQTNIEIQNTKSTCGAALMWCVGTSCSPAAEETAASKTGQLCKSLNSGEILWGI